MHIVRVFAFMQRELIFKISVHIAWIRVYYNQANIHWNATIKVRKSTRKTNLLARAAAKLITTLVFVDKRIISRPRSHKFEYTVAETQLQICRSTCCSSDHLRGSAQRYSSSTLLEALLARCLQFPFRGDLSRRHLFAAASHCLLMQLRAPSSPLYGCALGVYFCCSLDEWSRRRVAVSKLP